MDVDLEIRETENQDLPEFVLLDFDKTQCFHNLAIAIMMQAVRDAVSSEDWIRNDARIWLREKGETWAAAIGLNIEQFHIEKFLNEKRKERSVKKKIYKKT